MSDENEIKTEEAPQSAAEESAERMDPEALAAAFKQLQAERDELKDRMLREAADAENTRRRADREIRDATAYAVTTFAHDLLSVADNLARALQALSPDMRASMGETGRSLLSGVEMTEKELHTVLARHRVEPIPAAPGDKFDPNLHQAAAQIPSEHAAGAIAAVIQTGWRIGERTLRAAMVAVSSGAPPATNDPGAGEAGSPPAPGSTLDTKV